MKKTKTIEVEICDQCGDEITGSRHLLTCASCKKEICPNCVIHFGVTVQKVEPREYDRRGDVVRYAHTVSTRPPYKSELMATYCGICGNNIDANLIAAGFVKKPSKKSSAEVVMD